jgi:hypothetical protein
MAQLVGAFGVGAAFVTSSLWIQAAWAPLIVPGFLGCLAIYWWGRQP